MHGPDEYVEYDMAKEKRATADQWARNKQISADRRNKLFIESIQAALNFECTAIYKSNRASRYPHPVRLSLWLYGNCKDPAVLDYVHNMLQTLNRNRACVLKQRSRQHVRPYDPDYPWYGR